MEDRSFIPLGPFSLGEISQRIGARLSDEKQGLKTFEDVASLKEAGAVHLSFLDNPKYHSDFLSTKAGAVIVDSARDLQPPAGVTLLLASNPHKSFALAAQMFHPTTLGLNPGISDGAWVHKECELGKGSEVQCGSRVLEGAIIGKNSLIGANSVIGRDVIIGDNCRLFANVTISNCHMGDGVHIHPGARIGQAGFGFAMEKRGHTLVPQLGRVVIGNNVRIGANTTIDRGALSDTIIGNGCMVDNLVQIAHNVELGENCVVAGQSGIAGSSVLGNFVVLGGQSAVSGHLRLGNDMMIAGKSGVTDDLTQAGIYGGIPAVPIQQWRRQVVMLARLVKRRLKGR